MKNSETLATEFMIQNYSHNQHVLLILLSECEYVITQTFVFFTILQKKLTIICYKHLTLAQFYHAHHTMGATSESETHRPSETPEFFGEFVLPIFRLFCIVFLQTIVCLFFFFGFWLPFGLFNPFFYNHCCVHERGVVMNFRIIIYFYASQHNVC